MSTLDTRELMPARPAGAGRVWCGVGVGCLAISIVATGAAGHAAVQEPSLDATVAPLSDVDPRVRVDALRRLKSAGRIETLDSVAALLTDPVERVRLEAIDTVLEFFLAEPIEERTRVGLIIEVARRRRTEQAFAAGPRGILPRPISPSFGTHLVAAVSDPSPDARLDAVYLFGTIATPELAREAADRLVLSLIGGYPRERLAAARVLGRLRLSSAEDPLIHAMNDPVEEVVMAAMDALGEIRSQRAIRSLNERFLYYEGGPLAYAAFGALAKIGHSSSLPLFRERLGDSDAEIRVRAVSGLARAGEDTDADELERRVAVETSPRVRVAMTHALHRLGRLSLSAIVKGLAEPDSGTETIRYLTEAETTIIDELDAFLNDPEPRVRRAVAELIGLAGGLVQVEALRPLRADPEPEVAAAADLAIRRLELRYAIGPPVG